MAASFEKLQQRLALVAVGDFAPLQEAEILKFERLHDIKLPEEYRECLMSVSNGGPGLFRLGEVDSGWGTATWKEGDGFIGNLAAPFPYQSEWNDLSGMPSEDFDQNDREACSRWEKAREPFEFRYWGPLDGALPIAHVGCGIRHWLIITGLERGSIWEDDRANYQGLYPLFNEDGTSMGFRQWLDWQTSGPSA